MRLMLWLTLVCLCALSGDHVLGVLAGAVLVVCADDSAGTSRAWIARRRARP